MAIPDFKKDHTERQRKLTEAQIDNIFDKASVYDLSGTLRNGGSVIFPHSTIEVSGVYTAAAVNACLDSGADRVLVIGVLHALTGEMNEARIRVANGGRPEDEDLWGVQGPGLKGRSEWKKEFSLLNFLFLWNIAVSRRRIRPPELIMRFPYLAGGRPEAMPGIGELEDIALKDAVIVATMDPFHHGIGYGDKPENSFYPETGGFDLARKRIREGLDILERGDYPAYNRHCVEAKSDGRDAGQVLRHLLGPVKAEILDIVSDDMTEMYGGVSPTWVAGALIELKRTGK
jgi:hypothetical protein